MSLPMDLEPKDQNRGVPKPDSTNHQRDANSEYTSGPDSDFAEEEDVLPGNGGDTGNQKTVEEQVAGLAAGLAAAGELGAEKLVAGELAAAGKMVTEELAAAGKLTVEKLSAEKLIAEKMAAEKMAAGELVAKESVGEESEDNLIPKGEEIGEWLKEVIRNVRKGLQKMYGETEAELDKSLKIPIKMGEEMARKLITEMGCGREVAKPLTVLTLYDVAILIDDSDSMIYAEKGQRRETLIQFIDHITDIYQTANESGILAMRFMNGRRGKKNWTGKSQEYLNEHSYGGLTRIGTALKEKILDLFAIGNSNQRKPLLVLIVTDGAVEGERKGHLEKVIRDCVNERKGAGKGFDAVSFQFSRIGNDRGAEQLLIDLDDDTDLGNYIDVLPVKFDLEDQLKDKWWMLPKILLGAILPDWDRDDVRDQAEVPDHLANEGPTSGSAEDDIWD